MPDSTLILLAAGLGSRYGGLKQLEPVGPHGEFILHYSIYDALQAGFDQIVLVLRKSMFEAFNEGLGKTIHSMCKPRYVFQELDELPPGLLLPPERIKPWGTAHAVWCCRQQIDGPFAVVNADDFYGPSSYHEMRRLLGTLPLDGNTYGLAGYPVENTLSEHGAVARAICEFDSAGFLTGIQERTRVLIRQGQCGFLDGADTWNPIPEGACVSMNFWAFTPSIFNEFQNCFQEYAASPNFRPGASEFFLPDMVGRLLSSRKAAVKLRPIRERWFGITYPQDRDMVQTELKQYHQAGIYPHNLWETQIGSQFPQPG
jgi:choline kinase